MQVYSLHNPCRYVFVALEGPVILFDFKGCEHLSEYSVVVDEVRTARSWYHFNSGSRNLEHVTRWAAEIDDLRAKSDAKTAAVVTLSTAVPGARISGSNRTSYRPVHGRKHGNHG